MISSRLFLTVLATTIGLVNSCFSQNSYQNEKSEVLKTIFEQLKPKECTFIALLAEMDYRVVHITHSAAMPSSIFYDEHMKDDSISMREFAKAIKTDTCFPVYIKSFKQEKLLSRNDFIVSEKFLSNVSAWKQNKLYIEVQKPIGGWEIFQLFKFDKADENNLVMYYSLPFVFIPVFAYRVDDKETKSQFIFKFKLDYENNKTTVKFVSKTEL